MVPPNHWPLPPPVSPTELCPGTSNRKSAPMQTASEIPQYGSKEVGVAPTRLGGEITWARGLSTVSQAVQPVNSCPGFTDRVSEDGNEFGRVRLFVRLSTTPVCFLSNFQIAWPSIFCVLSGSNFIVRVLLFCQAYWQYSERFVLLPFCCSTCVLTFDE